MSKPLWWKNSVKLIKKFTSNDSYMTFDRVPNDNHVAFLYTVVIEGVEVCLEEMVTIDALEADRLQETLYEELHESLRLMLLDYLNDLDNSAIVGL